jgi:hypothetical protein
MTQMEIEPFGVSAQLKGMVSTWVGKLNQVP